MELLNNVECKDELRNNDIDVLLSALLTNQAIAALRTGAWRTAIVACDACLVMNPKNLKARARRAEAKKCLGELEAATEDLGFILRLKVDDLTDGQSDETAIVLLRTAQKEARKMLKEISELRQQESETARRMIAGSNFAADRERSRSSSADSKGTYEAMMTDRLSSGVPENEASAKKIHRKRLSEKLIDEVVALEIQRELITLYSDAEVQNELITMRKASDYETARFIQRLRPYLTKLVQEPILDKYDLGEGEVGYRKLETALGQHLATSEDAKNNAKNILGILMGDLMED